MSSTAAIPKNIVLIGFMGCGKSTVGRKLHQVLGYPFVDTDALIEQKAGCTIPEIFARYGEAYFRQLESAVLHELSAPDAPRRIIATGGGIIGRKQNRKQLRQLGFVVWLQAPVDTILERTGRNRDRPLLDTENPAERVSQLLEQRLPLYRETAHMSLNTKGLEVGEIATGILECARYHFAGPLTE
jgi:shikimate kinase